MAEGTPRGTGRLIGREHELALVGRTCAVAASGRRRLVMVSGDPGIGKTHFCEHAAAQAERAGFAVAWGRCWPHGGAPALWPWPPVLTDLLGDDGAQLLAGEGGHHRVDPERFARFAAVAARLSRDRGDAPTLVVIDDAHAAEEGALLLTRFFATALDRLPLIVMLARRPGPAGNETADRLLAELEREATMIALRRFDLPETSAFLAAHGMGDDRGVAMALLRLTGGSPLFLSRAVAFGLPPSGLGGLEHVISDALARLTAPVRRSVAAAAVLGRTAPVAEIAALTEQTPAVVLGALATAERAGLVDVGDRDCTFTHELVQRAALTTLPPVERLDAHARAAARLGPEHPERFAHHALAAAQRSDADARVAITACRAGARAMLHGFAYERAAALLDRAVAVAEHQMMRPPERAALLIERADAVLACGRLADARVAFAEAVVAADAVDDPVMTARAVLGLGGVWLHEHRNAADRQRVLAQQRTALDRLPKQEHVLRSRLALRLAAEAVYDGGPVEPVWELLAASRRLGDNAALAEGLSLAHHALLAPEHIRHRLPLAEELLKVASAAGDGMLAVMGLLWQTVDLYHLADPRADRTLADLRQRASALGSGSVGYIVTAIEVMRLIRTGSLEAAEAAASRCLQLGLDVGDADATGYYHAQLLTIRWLQGRDAELADAMTDAVSSPTLATPEFALRASMVSVLTRAGRHSEARAGLEALASPGLARLPRSSTWLAGMVAIAEAAWLLDDAGVAAEVYALLTPFAELPVMPSLAVTCVGVAHRAIGLAAHTMGDLDAAVTHLQSAVEADRVLGNRPVTAIAMVDLAGVLATRGARGDRARSIALLEEATTEAAAMGLSGRADAWAARLRDLRRTPRPQVAVLRGRETTWCMVLDDRQIPLPTLVGVGYLATLIERPGEDVSATDLCAAATVEGLQEVLDPTAIHAYRERVRRIDAEISDAESCADLHRAESLRLERETIATQLRGALGMGGRVRAFPSSSERARTAVRKAIRRALDAVSDAAPELGPELHRCIVTGSACRYAPQPDAARWVVERA